MTEIALTLGAFLLGVLVSEVLLGGGTTQSATTPILGVQSSFAGLVSVWLVRDGLSPVPALLFWSGALLAWTGIRLHIESSILLRLVYLLWSRGELTSAALLSLYEGRHGIGARLAEIERGGFAEIEEGVALVTPKGLRVARLMTLATRCWSRRVDLGADPHAAGAGAREPAKRARFSSIQAIRRATPSSGGTCGSQPKAERARSTSQTK